MRRVARHAVYALDVQPKQVDCLYALVHHIRNSRVVPPEQRVETLSKDWSCRRRMRPCVPCGGCRIRIEGALRSTHSCWSTVYSWTTSTAWRVPVRGAALLIIRSGRGIRSIRCWPRLDLRLRGRTTEAAFWSRDLPAVLIARRAHGRRW